MLNCGYIPNQINIMVKKRPQSMIDMAVKLYEQEGSAYVVAKQMGVSHKAVYNMLHGAGAPVPGWGDPKPRRRKFDGESAAAVVADYIAGMNWSQLKAKYGTSEYAMRECVRRAGVTLRDHGGQRRRISESEEAEIVSLLESGLIQACVARKFGCHQAVISRISIKHGVSDGKRATKDRHGSWKGGKSITAYGYMLERIYPEDALYKMAGRSGYVLQHRLVVARHINRALLPTETVHHINGDKLDNRIENLQLRQGKHGRGSCLQCADCGSANIIHTRIK